jgi:aarF domain-containing kinase
LVAKYRRIKNLAFRAVRLFLRALFLASVATPLAATYPLMKGNERLHKKWLDWCVSGVELSGAAIVKLFQWASSRPDMFGEDFCKLFCKLQDETTPHGFAHTEKLMEEAFGRGWKEVIDMDAQSPILGSGCIGQVYKGRMKDTKKVVAVKVLHPNIQSGIAADIDILRSGARLLNMYVKNAKWLNCPGMVEEVRGGGQQAQRVT